MLSGANKAVEGASNCIDGKLNLGDLFQSYKDKIFDMKCSRKSTMFELCCLYITYFISSCVHVYINNYAFICQLDVLLMTYMQVV